MTISNLPTNTKAYTALLLSIFDNLQIEDEQSNLYQVPIKYSNSSRLYKKLNSNNSKNIEFRTPIMGLIETDNVINLERAQNMLLRRKFQVNGNTITIKYNSTPVDFIFELIIISDTLTTMSKIKESIITRFHNNTYYIDYVSYTGETIRTPVILNEIKTEIDNQEDDFLGNRFIECRLTLTVEGFVETKIELNKTKVSEIELLQKDYSKKVINLLDTYTITG